MSDRFGEAFIYWTGHRNRYEQELAAGTAQPFQPGERVKGAYDYATVIQDRGNGEVLVIFDEVDTAGWRRPQEPIIRLGWTLTRVPQDTPVTAECEASRRYWASGRERWPGRV
jgi:hypothetical protein